VAAQARTPAAGKPDRTAPRARLRYLGSQWRAGDADGDPFIAYRRIEVDPVTGHGVLVETRPDDSFTRAIHEVHLICVDPHTGELKYDSAEKLREFKSASERESHVAALRPGTARTSDQPVG